MSYITIPEDFNFITMELSDYVNQYSVLSGFDEKSIPSLANLYSLAFSFA